MQVALLTYGSRGDVQPFVALGVGLRRAGHNVLLAAPARFAELAEAHDLAFAALPGDVEQLSRELSNRAGRNPITQVQAIRAHALEIAVEIMARLRVAVRGADVIVHTFLTTSAGHMLAQELGVPDISAQLFPFFVPYATFPNVAIPTRSLGTRLNQISHRLATLIFAQSIRLSYTSLRRRHPELGPARLPWPAPGVRTPLLLAYSSLITGPAPPAIPLAQTTGFWSLDAPTFQPPPELEAFLAAGPTPIFIGFGSMTPNNGLQLAAMVLEAVRRSGRRAVLQRGWASLGAETLPDDVIVIDEAPHAWLLPRMAAVIHHGGAGTTGAALQAGVPSMVVPFSADQPFWGRQVHRLGVGPAPIPARSLTADALIRALNAFDDPAIRRRAAAVGAVVRSEEGVGTAVQAIMALHSRSRA